MAIDNTRIIFGFPARRNKKFNPYNTLMSNSLDSKGWKSVDPSSIEALFGRANIVHLHWPQAVVSGPWGIAIRRTTILLATLLVQKIKGAKIVWTAHNLRSHNSLRPRLERLWMALVTRLLDGVVYLSAYSKSEALDLFPHLAKRPSRVVPHGTYGEAYPYFLDQSQARAIWDIPSKSNVIGFVGEIKPYKGLDQLLNAFFDVSPGKVYLLIAGNFPKDGYGNRLKRNIDNALNMGLPIQVYDGRLDELQLSSAISACDVVALPYLKGENSGLAVLAAERDRALLLPKDSRYDEISSQIAPDLSYRFASLTGDIIESATRRARIAICEGKNNEIFRMQHNWDMIAEDISDLYAEIIL